MKKIVVFNDIHSCFIIFEKIMESLKNEKIDDYIFCGDMITDGFDCNKVLDLAKSLTNNIIAGNREYSIVNEDPALWHNLKQWDSMLYAYNSITEENKSFIKMLPLYKIINIENKKICISHGSPYNVRDGITENSIEIFDKLICDFDCDIYLFAHTHKSFYKKYKNKLFINCGAISCNLDNIPCACSYGIITIDDDNIDYTRKEFKYNFDEVKNYYLSSDYYYRCKQWCTLLLNNLKECDKDYCCNFISFINSKKCNNISDIWEEEFENFIKLNNLETF